LLSVDSDPVPQRSGNELLFSCNVSVELNGFQGTVTANVLSSAFTLFRNDLQSAYATLNGHANLQDLEDRFRLGIHFQPREVIISGELNRSFSTEVCLTFSASTDQSYFLQTLQELDIFMSTLATKE
jgi:hypothetical protein